ncbi:MAG: taurine transport system permease protein [Thermoleophilaceae bacterium]|nr:taurine transport system permease protein [Thermoleophilaceae bacterium]
MTPQPSEMVEKTGLPAPTDDIVIASAGEKSEWRQGRYLSIVSLVLYFGAWFGLTHSGLVADFKLPSPEAVVEAAITLRSVIVGDILATVARVVAGLTLGVLFGVGLGLLMSYSKRAFYFFDPIVEMMRPVPVIAMIPFFLLWFGINEQGKLLLVLMGVFTIMVVSTVEAVRNVPRIYTRAASTLGASRNQTFRRVVLPAIVPSLIGPLRVAAALSFTLVVAAEFMGAQSGVGYRIMEARRLFNPDVIMLGIAIFGFLSFVLDTVVRKTTTYITRWSERTL